MNPILHFWIIDGRLFIYLRVYAASDIKLFIRWLLFKYGMSALRGKRHS